MRLFVKKINHYFALYICPLQVPKTIFFSYRFLNEVLDKRLVLAEMFPDTCIICTDTSGKDWNRCLPKLLFTGISKNWDPRHRDLGGIRDPRLETHLRSEIWDPRSETLNVRLKNWLTLIVRGSRLKGPRNWKLGSKTRVTCHACDLLLRTLIRTQ